MNLLQVVRNAALLSPNKVFAVCNKNKKTFKQFYERVMRAGTGFSSLGIKKGDKVALLLHNSVEFLEAYFGAISAGAVIVPINVFLKSEEVAFILNDCRVKALVTSADFEKVVDGINPELVPALENIISVDPLKKAKYVSYETLFKGEIIGKDE